MLKCRLYDNRDLTCKIVIHDFKEQIGDQAIGIRWELVVLNAVGVDVSLLDLIAAYNRHPQELAQLFSKSGFSRTRSAREDNALWFFVHASQ